MDNHDKYETDGSIKRYKVCLLAKGFTQTYDINYTETFALIAKINTVQILLSLATNLCWTLHQLDIKNAFLNGKLEEEIYMSQTLRFEEKSRSQIMCKLNKSLYELKQSAWAQFEKFFKVIKFFGYAWGQADHTLKHSEKGKITILIVYVDDIIVTGNANEEREEIKLMMEKEFEVKDLGTLKYFLGIEIARCKRVSLSLKENTHQIS